MPNVILRLFVKRPVCIVFHVSPHTGGELLDYVPVLFYGDVCQKSICSKDWNFTAFIPLLLINKEHDLYLCIGYSHIGRREICYWDQGKAVIIIIIIIIVH